MQFKNDDETCKKVKYYLNNAKKIESIITPGEIVLDIETHDRELVTIEISTEEPLEQGLSGLFLYQIYD